MKYFNPMLLAGLLLFFVCQKGYAEQFALLPDIHFQDIYAQPEALNHHPHIDKLVRSMHAQLTSTRLFNEPYFALLAALDEIAQQQIKWVILPGDFSDDGQPVHIQKLASLFAEYEKKYQMRFFLAPGNHDPVRPSEQSHGKNDFLQNNGAEFALYSSQHKRCLSNSNENKLTLCDDAIKALGYAGIHQALKNFGFTPRQTDLFFQTPFQPIDYKKYSYQQGLQAAALNNRTYPVCDEQGHCKHINDLSYVIEPVEGFWLLSIDANVYVPQDLSGEHQQFSGSSNTGYNHLAKHKPFLIPWITHVVKQAKLNDKKLLTFSHFPLGDFYDQAAEYVQKIGGKSHFNHARFPSEQTLSLFAQTGLQLHIAGHMHINDASIYKSGDNTLINIQAPSIAAYMPAYKVLTWQDDAHLAMQTHVLKNVDDFDKLFPMYQREWRYRQQHKHVMWDKDVLTAQSYLQLSQWHIRELVRLRYIPRNWGEQEQALLQPKAVSLWMFAQTQTQTNVIDTTKPLKRWQQLYLFDLLVDYYKLASADSLALKYDIDDEKIRIYRQLANQLEPLNSRNDFAGKIVNILHAILKYSSQTDAGDVLIDLQQGTIRPVE
ncbi:metallophosphoesterase [Catenovulum agarivorans DS-2]|uniref:Metallophosphoesterase n=1 Tax=Catenovulum agarivorans DS-2 TaxID=1328313 RepID=W7R256_9ALTE|nr:metallophosphoesterase [Catenovulum agarivorans]EWH11705.1 metallophosphoesterase [Catenovulum agarivorans DS-2]